MLVRGSWVPAPGVGPRGLVCPVLLAGQIPTASDKQGTNCERAQGQLQGRLYSLCECVCTYVRSLLMDFHPEQRGAGGGCWCRLYLPKCWVCSDLCCQTCVCCARVLCVQRGLSLTPRPDLGTGSWGCGASIELLDSATYAKGVWVWEKMPRFLEKSLLIKTQNEHRR